MTESIGYLRLVDDLRAAQEREAAEHGMTVDEYGAECERKRIRKLHTQAAWKLGEHAEAIARKHTRTAEDSRRIVEGDFRGWDKKPLTQAFAWFKSRAPFLVLAGGTGNGKTTAAIAVACHWARRGIYRPSDFARKKVPEHRLHDIDALPQKPLIVKGGNLHLHVHPKYDERKMGYAPEALWTPFLVIDELGGTSPEPYRTAAAVEEVFDTRNRDGLRTIATTNLNAESLRKLYGERVYDRIREGGHIAPIKAQSHRKAWRAK